MECGPTLITLTTYRLNPHSKGDDTREKSEVAWFRKHDPATLAVEEYPHYGTLYKEFAAEAADAIKMALAKPQLRKERYFVDQLPRSAASEAVAWEPLQTTAGSERRLAQQLNAFYAGWLQKDREAFFLGEDIEDPYGGAFKISKGFTTSFGDRVKTTPISEAAIAGMGIGLALTGRRAFVEIMFGDFITYAFDQIVNNASKMFHMYNGKMNCPVILRAPMGGRRGYGPTHSQSLERFLIGIDNVCTVSLNSLAHVPVQLQGLELLPCPVILLENKSDYAATTFVAPAGYVTESDGQLLPTLRVAPARVPAGVTVVAYGGMARFLADEVIAIFEQTDRLPELIVPVCLSPLNLNPIVESVLRTGRLFSGEEGSEYGSVGAEVIAQLQERLGSHFVAARVSGKAMPIPSAPSLEAAALPSIEEVCGVIRGLMEGAL